MVGLHALIDRFQSMLALSGYDSLLFGAVAMINNSDKCN